MTAYVPRLLEHATTVLLVDDQAIVAEAVRRMLSGEKDITFHYCHDPRTALGVSAAVSPTVILQDLVMPQMDGLTLVRHFRSSPHTRDVPLIVLSAEEDPKIKAEAFECGASDYIVKLPDKLELIARIRHHSRGYISMLQRNEAFAALIESQRELEIRNQFIRATFGRYVSDEVVNSLLATPEGLHLGGEKRTVTIMMADLRGFTAIAETHPPEAVVQTINNYLEVMTEVIGEYGGTINEIVGDGILIVFGAPLPVDDHAERAVACAMAMQLAMSRVNDKNERDALPHLGMGIGINTGEVIVGNIGSHRRTKYTMVGSNVNLTARIESYTSGNQVMIAKATKDAAGEILEIAASSEVRPKGMQDPITIYDVTGIGGRHGLHLPVRRAEMTPVKQAINVRFRVIAEKHGTEEEGTGILSAVADHDIVITTDASYPPFTNLRIDFSSRDGGSVARNAYGKVLSAGRGTLSVRLTSVPPDAAELLRSAC